MMWACQTVGTSKEGIGDMEILWVGSPRTNPSGKDQTSWYRTGFESVVLYRKPVTAAPVCVSVETTL